MVDFFPFFFFFYLKVRSTREQDQREQSVCPYHRRGYLAATAPKSTGVTAAWRRQHYLCHHFSRVYGGWHHKQASPPVSSRAPSATQQLPSPRPSFLPPFLPVPTPLSHQHCAIHAYLNHPRPIKKKREKKKKKVQTPLLTIILSFPVVTGAITNRGPQCRSDTRGPVGRSSSS